MSFLEQRIVINTRNLSSTQTEIILREVESQITPKEKFEVIVQEGGVQIDYETQRGNKFLIHGQKLLIFANLIGLSVSLVEEKGGIRGLSIDLEENCLFFFNLACKFFWYCNNRINIIVLH